ncbi:MAG: hypothetical protein ACRDO2_00855 [Nocardioidaceae bacterium]
MDDRASDPVPRPDADDGASDGEDAGAARAVRLPVQPIDVRDVAEQIVELALGQPAGLVPDLAGPRVFDMDELVRSYLRASGKRRLMLRMRVPGKAAAAYRAGANLAPERSVGRRTWEAFLAEQVSTTREPARQGSAAQRQSSAENAS